MIAAYSWMCLPGLLEYTMLQHKWVFHLWNQVGATLKQIPSKPLLLWVLGSHYQRIVSENLFLLHSSICQCSQSHCELLEDKNPGMNHGKTACQCMFTHTLKSHSKEIFSFLLIPLVSSQDENSFQVVKNKNNFTAYRMLLGEYYLIICLVLFCQRLTRAAVLPDYHEHLLFQPDQEDKDM